jgi:hypothetical protein
LENTDVFNVHLEYFTDIRDIYDHLNTLCSFGGFFCRFGTMDQEKSRNPGFSRFFILIKAIGAIAPLSKLR